MLYQLSYTHQNKIENITDLLLICKKIYPQIFIGEKIAQKQLQKKYLTLPENFPIFRAAVFKDERRTFNIERPTSNVE